MYHEFPGFTANTASLMQSEQGSMCQQSLPLPRDNEDQSRLETFHIISDAASAFQHLNADSPCWKGMGSFFSRASVTYEVFGTKEVNS